MRRLLLLLQTYFIDGDDEFTFTKTKRRTVQVTLQRRGQTVVSTWENYKNGELHIISDQFAAGLVYHPKYDEQVVFDELRQVFMNTVAILNTPALDMRQQGLSQRKLNAPPDKHVMNKHERKLMTQLRAKSGKTEAEVRQDPAARRQLAEARMLSNKPAGDHVFDGRAWVTPHVAASRAVTKARASGVTKPVYQDELEKALRRAK